MDPLFALKLEHKVDAVRNCNVQLKNKGLPLRDSTYTLKTKEQYLNEIKKLIDLYPELNHHPALLKIEQEFNN